MQALVEQAVGRSGKKIKSATMADSVLYVRAMMEIRINLQNGRGKLFEN
jgi:hypothetical protein